MKKETVTVLLIVTAYSSDVLKQQVTGYSSDILKQ